jgi:PAS domain S-box-containing protein
MPENRHEVEPAAFERHTTVAIAGYIGRIPFLRNIFIVCLATALFFPLYNWFSMTPAYRDMLTRFKVHSAQRTAAHMMRALNLGNQPVSQTSIDARHRMVIEQFKTDFGLEKLQLYSPAGKVVFSTSAADIGQVNRHAYFSEGVARGRVYSKVVEKGTLSSEARPLALDVVEIYIPIVKEDTFLGALEIYCDITEIRADLNRLILRTNGTMVLIAVIITIIMVAVLFKAGNAMLSHRETDAALRSAHDLLERRVEERTLDLIESNKDLQMEILERRQAEEALRISERRFRSLIETIPHCIQEIDRDGTITFANPSHVTMYGYDEKELTGKPIYHLAADEDNKRQIKAHFEYLMNQQPTPSPWFSKDRTRSGRIIQTQVDWNYKKDAQGRVEGMIAVISNITHRKQAEKALLDNLNFMTTLIDTIPNPVFYKDTEGLYLGCNVAYAEIIGLPKDSILGRRLIDLPKLSFSDMADHYHRQDLELIQRTGVHAHEERILCADGSFHDYILFKATFEDIDGAVAGLVGIMLDITERKTAEKEVRKSKALFDAFMEHLPGLAYIKDSEGRYLFVNEAFARFTGCGAAASIGLCDDQVWEQETARLLKANDAELRRTQQADSQMETVRLSDGRPRHLLTVRFPIFQDEAPFSLGGVSIDVTERTQAEQQRHQLEQQLQQAQKMEALGTLAGGIAHDFNNILAAIIGFTEIAAADIPKDSDNHHFLQRVLEAGERARALVKQILTFSRRSEIEPKPVQVKLIVKEVLKLLRGSLPVNITIVQQIHSDDTVMADPVQIHQVMMNLCTNAGYAMRENGGVLTVRLERVDLDETFTNLHGDLQPGRYLRLSVADTGRGITPENLSRVFDPFFTTKPKGEGTGMGLSVVHGIVTHLGGVITVQSAPEQGAVFDVYLPAIENHIAMPRPEVDAMPTGSERILFVDDEAAQTEMIRRMLGLLGYTVTSMNNSSAALELFEKDPTAVDLVITDMIMPQMNGEELARRMLTQRPDLPVILCTGYSEHFSEADAKALGIKGFVLKPLVMADLARLVRRVLDNERTHG